MLCRKWELLAKKVVGMYNQISAGEISSLAWQKKMSPPPGSNRRPVHYE